VVKLLNSFADRMVRKVVPKAEAMAACSGCWTVCAGGSLYKCCYKPNCTDTCSYVRNYC
jgi:hypothetical protein